MIGFIIATAVLFILSVPIMDCQHCGDEWEYQCEECEKAEEEEKHIKEMDNIKWLPLL